MLISFPFTYINASCYHFVTCFVTGESPLCTLQQQGRCLFHPCCVSSYLSSPCICPPLPQCYPGSHPGENQLISLMSRYAPPHVLRSRPHCDVYGWTEVSLSSGTVIALLRLPSAFRVKILSALPNEESSRIDLACSRVVPYVPEKVPGVCLFSFQSSLWRESFSLSFVCLYSLIYCSSPLLWPYYRKYIFCCGTTEMYW